MVKKKEPTSDQATGKLNSPQDDTESLDARIRILRVALREFAEKGYEGATTAAIARAAGVTQPLVHYYFSSKEALWKAAVDLVCSKLRLLDESEMVELRDLEPVTQLKVLARRFVSFACKCPEFARILTQEGVRGGPRFSYLADEMLRPMMKVLETALAKGQKEGWLKPIPVQHLLFLWLGAASQMFSAPALANEMGVDPSAPATVQQYSDAYVEMMFHGLTKTPEAPPAAVTSADPAAS